MNTIIVDIDGTLLQGDDAIISEIKEKGIEWLYALASDEFEEKHKNCIVIEPIRWLIRVLYRNINTEIILCTGRPEKFRMVTEGWLHRNSIVWYNELYMRRNGDEREDCEVKRDMLKGIGKKNVLLAIEDRPQVVDMWRRQGVFCLQCEGNGIE